MIRRALFAVTALLVSLPGVAASKSPASGPGYHLVKKLAVGGEGGWDYLTVDSAARRLYVSRSTHVLVFDADSGAPVGEIPNTPGVHGVALLPQLDRGFTSNGRSSTVTVFELKSLKTLSEVKTTGDNPDAIVYDPASRRVFTFNGRGANATAIDPATSTVSGTVKLDGKPEFAVADGTGRIFVNIEDKSLIDVIDSRKLSVEGRWPLAPCEEPSGMAFDAKHQRLFSGCANRMMAVVDAANGRVVTTVPIGEGVDANVFDPASGLAFASCGDGTMTVAHEDSPDKLSVIQKVQTQRSARTMAFDEKTGNVYLAAAEFGPPPSPTPEQPRPRPVMVPGSFVLLIFGPGSTLNR